MGKKQLTQLAARENIIAHTKTFTKVVQHWNVGPKSL